MATAGALLAGSAMAGTFVGSVVFAQEGTGGLLRAALFTTTASTIGTFLQNALRLPSPGSFFIVMVAGGSTMMARLGLNPVEVGAWALIGAGRILDGSRTTVPRQATGCTIRCTATAMRR